MNFKIFIFFCYTELFASVIERNETLWTKLNTYKAKTGISDDVREFHSSVETIPYHVYNIYHVHFSPQDTQEFRSGAYLINFSA